MIVSKTSFRISLCGGSTDSPSFIEKYGIGSVISFTPNIYTYVSIHRDVNGINNLDKKYFISYSKNEVCESSSSIKNELVRCVLEYFNCDAIKICLNSDVFSNGSGLASSSSYVIGLVSIVSKFCNKNLTDSEICNISFEIESKINRYNGYQDIWGCYYGGLKRITFEKNKDVKIEYLKEYIFNDFNFYLIYTGVKRRSSSVLCESDIDKSFDLLSNLEKCSRQFELENYGMFFKLLRESWAIKKFTNKKIVGSKKLKSMDLELENDDDILYHKLCGAGGGGYFLVVSKREKSFKMPFIKIDIESRNSRIFEI